jgi:hypothetical protein
VNESFHSNELLSGVKPLQVTMAMISWLYSGALNKSSLLTLLPKVMLTLFLLHMVNGKTTAVQIPKTPSAASGIIHFFALFF